MPRREKKPLKKEVIGHRIIITTENFHTLPENHIKDINHLIEIKELYWYRGVYLMNKKIQSPISSKTLGKYIAKLHGKKPKKLLIGFIDEKNDSK